MPPPYLLIVYTFTLASLARLITIDALLDTPRGAFVAFTVRANTVLKGAARRLGERLDDRPWTIGRAVMLVAGGALLLARFLLWFIAKNLTCPWCVSFWLALLLLWGRAHWENPVVLFVALALAMRLAAGILADR